MEDKCDKCGITVEKNKNIKVCDNDCGNVYCDDCCISDNCDFCGKTSCYYCGGSTIITCCCTQSVCLQCILVGAIHYLFCETHKSIICSECTTNDKCKSDKNINIYRLILDNNEFRKQITPSMDDQLCKLFKTEWRHEW